MRRFKNTRTSNSNPMRTPQWRNISYRQLLNFLLFAWPVIIPNNRTKSFCCNAMFFPLSQSLSLYHEYLLSAHYVHNMHKASEERKEEKSGPVAENVVTMRLSSITCLEFFSLSLFSLSYLTQTFTVLSMKLRGFIYSEASTLVLSF